MSFDPEFLELMPSTISVFAYTGFNFYGEPAYSPTATTYRCYIQEQPTEVLTAFGRNTIASHTVYVASTARIDITAKIVMPDGSEPHLIRSDVMYDEEGIHHVVLFFGSEQT